MPLRSRGTAFMTIAMFGEEKKAKPTPWTASTRPTAIKPDFAPRPEGAGAFFDYVCAVERGEVRRPRSGRALLALRRGLLSVERAEQRWEEEGGASAAGGS